MNLKKEITKETKDKIEKFNERFKIANNNIPVYLKKYKEHIIKQGKNFVFFTEELKTLVDNLENLHNKYKEVNKELNASLAKFKENSKILKEAEEKLNSLNDIMQSRKWNNLKINQMRKTIKTIDEIIKPVKELTQNNQEAKRIYYNLVDFKNVLIAKKDYLKAKEEYNKILILKMEMSHKMNNGSISKEDVNKIEKAQEEILKIQKMITERIEKCGEHISKKSENCKHLYFVDDMQYVLNDLCNIDIYLDKLAKEIYSLPTKIKFNITDNIQHKSKDLEKEFMEIVDAMKSGKNYDEDKVEEKYKNNIKEFNRENEEFQKEYEKSYDILKNLDPDLAKNIEQIYNNFTQQNNFNEELNASLTKFKENSKILKEAKEKLNSLNDIMQSRKWNNLKINQMRKTIKTIDEIIKPVKELTQNNQEAKRIYYNLVDFKNVLIAKKDYLKAKEEYNKILILKMEMSHKMNNGSISKEDVNKIEKAQEEILKIQKMITERIEKCGEHISKKSENCKHLYFVDDMQYVLNDLCNIDIYLDKLAKEIYSLPTKIKFNITDNIQHKSKDLEKEFMEIVDAMKSGKNYDEDKVEEKYKNNIKEFNRENEEFQKEYEKSYDILKNLDPDLAKNIEQIYNNFTKQYEF